MGSMSSLIADEEREQWVHDNKARELYRERCDMYGEKPQQLRSIHWKWICARADGYIGTIQEYVLEDSINKIRAEIKRKQQDIKRLEEVIESLSLNK